ncbi:MAG: hypothetical protein KAT05_08170, partial [Spirochaetes bacterium]|nr:hypothetical protein [Spirochaetota bacterium]
MTFFKNFFILFIMCMIVLIGCDRLQMLTEEEFDALVDSEGTGEGDTGEWSMVGSDITQNSIEDISLYVNNGIPYVACAVDNGPATSFICLNEYTGGNWKPYNSNDGEVQYGFYGAYNVDLKFHNNQPYVAYIADTLTTTDAYVRTFGSGWYDVSGFAVGVADGLSDISLAIDSTALMYVAFKDSGFVLQVYEYVAGWNPRENLGMDNQYYSIAQYTGTPYIAYVSTAAPMAPNIMEYNYGGPPYWNNLGLINDYAGDLAFCINNTGIKYIAYSNEDDGSKLAVRKYSGSSWLDVGSGPVTPNSVSKTCMFVDGNDVYVAFSDTSVDG